MISSSRAIRVTETEGRIHGALVHIAGERACPLADGKVLIKNIYSGINYKDALAVTGQAPIMRRLPCIAGIEAFGIVERSTDTRFHINDLVMVHGFGMGVEHDGGFAEYVCVPGQWVMPLPDGLELFEAAAIGVAGYTSALAIHRMEQSGLTPDAGPVVVTGATGGVSSIGIMMLAKLGYEVVAITGKTDAVDWLKDLGASNVLPRSAVEPPGKPLRSARWAGALDSVGGETLAWLASTMREGAPIAAFGNTGGNAFSGSVLPFILRGIELIGIQSNSPMSLRKIVWARIADDLRPHDIDAIARTIALEDVLGACERQIRGEIRGRSIIRLD